MMSEKSVEDDFFGIEYMSYDQFKRNEGGAKDSRNKVKISAGKITHAVDNCTKMDGQLSGTEFLENAFFEDGLKHHERITSDFNEQPQDFFEENFFKRLPLKDITGAASPLEVRKGISKGNEESLHQNQSGNFPVGASRKQLGREEDDSSRRINEDHTAESSRDETVQVDSGEEMAHRSVELSGLEKIRSKIIRVWNMNQEELVDLMADRVVYNDDEIVAFDKPYGMAYSGASQNTPQLDRLLQKIKAVVAPKCERLYLVKSLEKYQSGIVVFATNPTTQSALKECIDAGLTEQVSRCIVRGELNDSPLRITIPLVKTMKNKDMKMMPLVSNKAKGSIFYVESECRTIKGNQYVSNVEVITHKDAPHQIRAHLALAGCPLIGDSKYSTSSPRPPRLSHHVLNTLDITDSQSRKIPMYLHLKQVNFSGTLQSSKPIRISAPLPEHFSWMLRKLRLLKLRY